MFSLMITLPIFHPGCRPTTCPYGILVLINSNHHMTVGGKVSKVSFMMTRRLLLELLEHQILFKTFLVQLTIALHWWQSPPFFPFTIYSINFEISLCTYIPVSAMTSKNSWIWPKDATLRTIYESCVFILTSLYYK